MDQIINKYRCKNIVQERKVISKVIKTKIINNCNRLEKLILLMLMKLRNHSQIKVKREVINIDIDLLNMKEKIKVINKIFNKNIIEHQQ